MKTHIVFVLDLIFSDCDAEKDLLKGFNKFLSNQKKFNENASISLFGFDSYTRKEMIDIPIKECKALTLEHFDEDAYIDSCDSIPLAIEIINAIKQPEDRVIFALIYGWRQLIPYFTKEIISLMDTCYDTGCWTFLYLGQCPDSDHPSYKAKIYRNGFDIWDYDEYFPALNEVCYRIRSSDEKSIQNAFATSSAIPKIKDN